MSLQPGQGLSVSLVLIGILAAGPRAQQPDATVPLTNKACDTGPKMVGGKPDTLQVAPDAEGFVPLFDGKSLKGWWEHCNNSHANPDRTNGGIWVADSTQGILYAKQGSNGAGSLLATNKSYDHYEITFEFWPVFGNDAGLFNRVTSDGKTWQTGLDYIRNSGIGGSYSENGWSPTAINDDPFKFGDTYMNPTISTWTTFTANQNPTSFGCSAGGCTSADFVKVWNPNGWNQMRVKFYGGLTSGSQVNMETWMRKVQDPPVAWVPIYKNSKSVVTPAAPIALQIHGGTDMWKSGAMNLYRNIKIRPLNIDGSPIIPVNIRGNGSDRKTGAVNPGLRKDVSLVGDRLTGSLEADTEITVRDARGAEALRFHASAGRFEKVLPAEATGVLLVDFKRRDGVDRFRLCRLR